MRCVFATTKRLLATGAVLIAIAERSGRGLGVPTVAGAVLLFFLLIVPGSTTSFSAADPSLSAFGEGAVEVRVHTDYFCDPCRAEEREVGSESRRVGSACALAARFSLLCPLSSTSSPSGACLLSVFPSITSSRSFSSSWQFA